MGTSGMSAYEYNWHRVLPSTINPVIALVDPGPVLTIAQPKFFVTLLYEVAARAAETS